MFFLAALFLVVLAGLIHRYPRLEATDLELFLIEGGLGLLWLVFLVEAAFRLQFRDRARPLWKALLGTAACVLLPPLRMGCRSLVRVNHIWLPFVGWREINRTLRSTLERFFSVPMILVALMVVPLLAFEYLQADWIRADPVLALCLDIGTSVIWLAFAVELILMVAVSDRPVRYCCLHWIDMVIVLLPAVELLPVFRLLRMGRVLRAEQLLRWGRLHRLQALVARAWRAFLLLQVVQRLGGRSPKAQLTKLRDVLQAKEEEVADLRREIKELEERMARQTRRRPAGPTASEFCANGPEVRKQGA
jgi:voltage-gated potassium channel